jgi:hypothetical protein
MIITCYGLAIALPAGVGEASEFIVTPPRGPNNSIIPNIPTKAHTEKEDA